MFTFKRFLSVSSGTAMLAALLAFPVPVSAQLLTYNAYTFPKEPFHKEVVIKFEAGKKEGFGYISVPSYKRMVIEHVSAYITLRKGQNISRSRIETLQASPGTACPHYLSTHAEGGDPNFDNFSISQSLRLYAVGNIQFAFYRTDTIGIGFAYPSISGYLVKY